MMMAGGVAARIVAHLLQLSMSRSAEYDADRVAAELCGNDAMISALEKIDAASSAKRKNRSPRAKQQPALSSMRGGAFAHAYISNGHGGERATANEWWAPLQPLESGWKKMSVALSTHPTTESRIEALRARGISSA